MVITDIVPIEYSWQRPRAIRNGKYTYATGGLSLFRIDTDEGVTGLGLGSTGMLVGGVGPGLEQFKSQLIGQDPLDVERHWDAMWQPKLVGRRGLTTRTLSAIDIGLWDIRAKVAGMPLHKMLGGYRTRVPTYIAGGYYEDGKTLDDLADEMASYVAMGTRAVKMKVGGVPMKEDIERVRIVREAIGPDVNLMVDANNAYRAREAIQMAEKMAPYDIYWFEEPVAPDDYRGHAVVAQSTTIPIATGENEYTRYGFRDLIEHESAAIFNPDANILGGITEFMKVAALAQAYDLDIAPHGKQEVHVHLVSAIPNGLIVEFYAESTDPMWGKTFMEHLQLRDGCVEPPDRPGLGFELNEEALAPHRVL